MSKPVVFVSYSHKDKREKDQLVGHLKVLEDAGLIKLWIDDQIIGGADWRAEIEQAMTQASIAVLLITANFLTSEFIRNKEIARLLKRREREGLIIVPVLAKDCVWQVVEWLTPMNIRPKGGIPVWGKNSRHTNKELAGIANEIAYIIKNLKGLQDFSSESPRLGDSEKQPTDWRFDLINIRTLLVEGFTDHELRRLCYDEPDFRPVYEQLTQGMGKDSLIDKLVEYAERRELIEILLAKAKERNPTKYERHQPYHIDTPDPTISNGIHGNPQRAKLGSNYTGDDVNFSKMHRRIDAAAPSYAEVGQRITLLVQVRFPNSPLLGIEDWPGKKQPPPLIGQVSEEVALKFPRDPQTGEVSSTRLEIQITAPDFEIHGTTRKLIEIPPDQYSKNIQFLLTAKRGGNCRIDVEVYSADHVYLGTIPVETTVGGITTTPTVTIVTHLFLLVTVGEQKSPTIWEGKIYYQNMLTKERDSLYRRLQRLHETLWELEEQLANYGLNRPVEIVNAIKEQKENIEQVEKRLQEVRSESERMTPEPLVVVKRDSVEPQIEVVDKEIEQPLPEQPIESTSPPSTSVTSPVSKPSLDFTHNRATTVIAENVSMSWVRIPTGSFKRGCPEEFIQYIENKYGVNVDVFRTFPAREETIEAYWMSVTPITNAQFYAFVRATGHRYPVGWRGTTPPYQWTDANKPVTGVTWQDSLDFANWLAARLPTRAEYEKACRGEDGRLYPWGNHFDPNKCNTIEAGPEHLTPVDAYPAGASVYGLLDLVGNAWEWATDENEGFRMTVGSSYGATGEIYGAGFFDVSRSLQDYEADLGFRAACSNILQLRVMHLKFEDEPTIS
jgi:formylglycine-generating enzyme required for sulfatase activity